MYNTVKPPLAGAPLINEHLTSELCYPGNKKTPVNSLHLHIAGSYRTIDFAFIEVLGVNHAKLLGNELDSIHPSAFLIYHTT